MGPGKRKISLLERLRLREIEAAARKKGRTSPAILKDLSWLGDLPRDQNWWRVWAAVSAAVDLELEGKRLLKPDYDKYCAPLEDGIPALIKRAAFRHEESVGENSGAYDPESVDAAFESGELAFEGEDEAPGSRQSPEAGTVHPFAPRRTVPALNALMRSSPTSLKASIARDLFDTFYFLDHEPKDLLPALCFFEAGVEDQGMFEALWAEVYRDGRFHRAGKQFSYSEFQKDKLRLFHLIKKKRKTFFKGNRQLLEEVSKISGSPAMALASLWDRLDGAISSLTRKQRNALVEVHVKGKSQARVAKSMKISLDSLRDRLESGEKKIRKALPELARLATPSSRKAKDRALFYSGLFDRQEAEKTQPVFLIDPVSGERTELKSRRKQKFLKPGVDRAEVLAWCLESTPVPDFAFTDYFQGLISRGALDRRSTFEALHDRGSARASYSAKLKAHQDRKRGSEPAEE